MKVLITDAINGSHYFKNGEIDCIVTSPPYFQCRNYNGNDKQIGLEKTVEDYIANLCEVFDSYKIKLNEHGNLFINIGDKYDKNKNLLLVPYLFATEMQKRGWILRNDIIWHKPNFQPSPVKDRLANAYEHVFHFVKNKNYYYDLDSIRISNKCDESDNERVLERFKNKIGNSNLTKEEKHGCLEELKKLYDEQKINKDARLKLRDSSKPLFGGDVKLSGRAKELDEKGYCFHCNNPKGKNMGDVLSINIKSHHGSHEAVYPPELVQPLIKCGSPTGGLVVDCFSGSGTTIIEAERLNRIGVGVEINRLYVDEMSANNLEIIEY